MQIKMKQLQQIYALVIASLMVPAAALALMADRALAAESDDCSVTDRPLASGAIRTTRTWS
jgi:hypothetical protein